MQGKFTAEAGARAGDDGDTIGENIYGESPL